ncbi:hypothetical protein [Acinetobacter larvae]|uniref:Uncharacterized protein n=1 Tax=Acinetobacter larvae TaxID=1789224 RepID=A0A1B2M187_9GAMM|nr:hypothetical protein [Acinetobacter larvae]AOA58964.1 hypothetical protein BFG52_11795 [Acinetobacter larvae]
MTYRYIFKNEKLISATTITLDQQNPDQMESIWEDPEYEPTIENFEQAKQTFSKEQLHQCQ